MSHGAAVGSARPVDCETITYSTAEGLPLPSFVVATSLPPLTYPSKIASNTFAAGAWSSPLELNFKHRKGVALMSGVKLKVTGGVNVEGSARFDKGAVPAALSATPEEKTFQSVNCFTLPGLAALSSNIAYDL